MSRVSQDPRLPMLGSVDYEQQLNFQLVKLLREFATQLNQLSEGSMQAVTNSATAAPTAGKFQLGDKIWNSNPVVAGAASSQYIILGWVCTTAGSTGTFVFKEMRTLTGT